MRVLHDHRACDRLRVLHRLIKLFFGNVLDILINREHQVLPGDRLMFDVGKPLLARVDRKLHLPRLAAQC